MLLCVNKIHWSETVGWGGKRGGPMGVQADVQVGGQWAVSQVV